MEERSVGAVARTCAQVQPLWAQLRSADRAHYLTRAAQAVVDEREDLADLLSRAHERRDGEVLALEVLPAIDALAWLADAGPGILGRRRLGAPRGTHPSTRAWLTWQPLGVVAVRSDRHEPFAVPVWRVAAALLAGNGVVLAPDPGAEAAAERIARVFARASLPEGLLGVAAGAAGIEDAGVARVFGGGPLQGGAALVLADATTRRAARGVATAAFAAGGRGRGAAKRAWVAREVHDAWVEAVVRAAGWFGPAGGGEAAADLVADAVAAGAVLRCGGPLGAGVFAPAVVTGVRDDMALAREVVDAPVLAVTAIGSADEGIEAAAGAPLHGGASVWTENRHEGSRIADELPPGPVWLNDHLVAPALPAVPWGAGLGGEEGLRAYGRPRPVTWERPSRGGLWWAPHDPVFARAVRAVVRLRSVRDRDRAGAWRQGALPLARVAARALRR